jgi:hypothetical protein
MRTALGRTTSGWADALSGSTDTLSDDPVVCTPPNSASRPVVETASMTMGLGEGGRMTGGAVRMGVKVPVSRGGWSDVVSRGRDGGAASIGRITCSYT